MCESIDFYEGREHEKDDRLKYARRLHADNGISYGEGRSATELSW